MIKRKLYISCPSLACGGAERVLSLLCNSFVNDYEEVKIFTWDTLPVFYTFDKRIEIVNIEEMCKSKNIVKKMIGFRKCMRISKPDVILSFLSKSSVFVILSTLGQKIPIIAAERNDPSHLRGGKIMICIRNFLFNFATAILEQTERNKNYFKGRKREKTSVIYNPVFLNSKDVGSAAYAKKKKSIVAVGRLSPQKNFKLLIRAYSLIHKKYPEYTLWIYGEGEERNELAELARTLNVGDCVYLPGTRKNVFEEVRCHEIFVMTSMYEGMPNALIEAMCLGMPCVSTKVSGATELIQDKENGLLIDVNNEEQLYSAIVCLIENDAVKQELGQKAQLLYEDLNMNVIYKQWKDFVDKIANECDCKKKSRN